MLQLVLGLVLFLGVHSIAIVAPTWRDAMAAKFGNAWRGAYSLISLFGFILIVHGYGLTRLAPQVLWVPPGWTRHVAMTLMLPVFPLLFAAYLPGRIKTTLKHPMLAAVKFWALSHLIANGMLADVLLFGGFLLWAVADRISLKRRPVRAIQTLPARPYNDVLAVVVGLALYMAMLFGLHRLLIGVSLLS